MKVRKHTYSDEDWQLIKTICQNCGSKTIKQTFGYLQRLAYFDKSKLLFRIFDETAFFAGTLNKNHIRVIAIAVSQNGQRKGMGRAIMYRVMKRARMHGISEITLRTSKTEQGLYFWRALGAVITGEKGADWEMKLKF